MVVVVLIVMMMVGGSGGGGDHDGGGHRGGGGRDHHGGFNYCGVEEKEEGQENRTEERDGNKQADIIIHVVKKMVEMEGRCRGRRTRP